MFVLDAVVELVDAGVDEAGGGAAAGLVPAFSEEAGVLVFSVSDDADFSGDSLPEPGFILSE